MSDTAIWLVIGGMALTNIVFRLVPISALSRLDLPRPVERWLSYIPVSAMAAIVASQVLTPDGHFVAPWDNPSLLATIPTAITYHFTRSFLWATVIGVLSFLALRYLLG